MNGTAERIEAFREKSGKSESEIAEAMGVETSYYSSLEKSDEQFFFSTSISEALKLAEQLGIDLLELLAPDSKKEGIGRMSFSQLSQYIINHIGQKGITIEEFEEQTGWQIEDFISNPESGRENPIIFLIDVGKALEIDWLSLVPEE